jgi:5-carboxymethyl-2-hydroxymuconate isomerase
MPNLIIEYSKNLAIAIDIDALVETLHATAANIDAFPLGGLRTRAVAREHYRLADGHKDNAFLNLVIRIAPGRSFDVRKSIGETVFAALSEFLEPTFASSPLSISLEIQELDAELRWKQNNFREYMAKRSAE